MSRAGKAAARSARHYDKKTRAARARGPLDVTAVAFDEWRRLVSVLPADIAAAFAGEMTAAIKAETAKLRPAERGDGK